MNNAQNILNTAKETFNGDHKEGKFTKAIEQQTAKIPSVSFLTLAIGAIGVSLGLEVLTRKKETANFIGLWVPTLLLFGIYNKLVKLHGSEG